MDFGLNINRDHLQYWKQNISFVIVDNRYFYLLFHSIFSYYEKHCNKKKELNKDCPFKGPSRLKMKQPLRWRRSKRRRTAERLRQVNIVYNHWRKVILKIENRKLIFLLIMKFLFLLVFCFVLKYKSLYIYVLFIQFQNPI